MTYGTVEESSILLISQRYLTFGVMLTKSEGGPVQLRVLLAGKIILLLCRIIHDGFCGLDMKPRRCKNTNVVITTGCDGGRS